MIRKLRGRVDEIGDDSVILDVAGVGYHVFCSTRTLASLNEGEAAALITETHVREDHIHLYGFLSHEERDWFLLLTSVQGVGVKLGLAIQGALSTDQMLQAIAAQDKATFNRVSGVGPKLAERIITELKNKVAKMPATAQVIALPTKGKAQKNIIASVTEDAVSALVNLGYSRMEAFSAVGLAMQKASEKAKLDELIRLGLKELAR